MSTQSNEFVDVDRLLLPEAASTAYTLSVGLVECVLALRQQGGHEHYVVRAGKVSEKAEVSY